jgi:hypothetical protein
MGLVHGVALALLSPILFPAYMLSVDPMDPEDAPRPKRKPWLPAGLVYWAFHSVAMLALLAGAKALCGYTAPAWAEAAANTLLGNGRVGEALTACSLLDVPRSPAMQLCAICAIYCYYRCLYHFEAWYMNRYPEKAASSEEEGEEGPAGRRSALARQEVDRITRRLIGPRVRALVWVVMLIGGPNKWLYNWTRSTLAQHGIFLV